MRRLHSIDHLHSVRPSAEADYCSGGEEIVSLLWNLQFHSLFKQPADGTYPEPAESLRNLKF
jgi:hypothetical protein